MKFLDMLPAAFAGAALAQSGGGSLTEVIRSQNDTLSLLGQLLSNNSAIVDTLSDATNITVLAPSNDALESLLNSSTIQDASPGFVEALLTYHVLNGTYLAENITDTPTFVPTLLGNSSYENVTGAQVIEAVSEGDTVSFYSGLRAQANVTQADIEFDGGVLHIINEVLTIPLNLTATAIEGGLSAVAGAITEADLNSDLEQLEDITVFAPNNDAFAAIASVLGNLSTDDLTSILQYHVIEGSVLYSSDLANDTEKTAGGQDVNITVVDDEVYVNSARVIMPDIIIANGVVHIIDSVLNPNATDSSDEPNPSTTTPAFTGASTASDGAVPFTSDVPEPSESATGLDTETSEEAAPRATAAMAMGALFGGAAILMNGV